MHAPTDTGRLCGSGQPHLHGWIALNPQLWGQAIPFTTSCLVPQAEQDKGCFPTPIFHIYPSYCPRALDWLTPSDSFAYWNREQKQQPRVHFLGHSLGERALHPSLSHCRHAGFPSMHKLRVLPRVFLIRSTRKWASSWIRSSMLFFPIPKSRRVVSVNRRSCFQVSPLLVTTPDTGRKNRPQWRNLFFFSPEWDATQ